MGNTFPPDDSSTDKIVLVAQVARFVAPTPKKVAKTPALFAGGLIPAFLRIEKKLNIFFSIDQKSRN